MLLTVGDRAWRCVASVGLVYCHLQNQQLQAEWHTLSACEVKCDMHWPQGKYEGLSLPREYGSQEESMMTGCEPMPLTRAKAPQSARPRPRTLCPGVLRGASGCSLGHPLWPTSTCPRQLAPPSRADHAPPRAQLPAPLRPTSTYARQPGVSGRGDL